MYYCIVNPSARSGKGKEIWERLENKLISASIDYKAAYTKGPGDATALMEKLTINAPDNMEFRKMAMSTLYARQQKRRSCV